MSQKLVRQIHNGIVVDCIKQNVTDPKEIRKIATAAVRRMSIPSVSGVKAAMTKGQRPSLAYPG